MGCKNDHKVWLFEMKKWSYGMKKKMIIWDEKKIIWDEIICVKHSIKSLIDFVRTETK